MFWNTWTDRHVTRYDERTERNPETGIMLGAEPLSLGPENSGKAILMVHGFVGSPNNFNDLPVRVAEAGWHVRVMLLPGHGTTPRNFETTPAEELEQAVANELDMLRNRFSTVVLLGHSMGGALATIIAARHRVDALILVSPYYAVTHRWYYLLHPETWARLMSPVVRWIYSPPHRQPVNRVEAREKIVSYHWIPTRGALTAMDLAARASGTAVKSGITMPTLLIHSSKDSITDPQRSASVFNAFPTKDKRTVWLQRSDHIVFWDFDQGEVNRSVVTFLHDIVP